MKKKTLRRVQCRFDDDGMKMKGYNFLFVFVVISTLHLRQDKSSQHKTHQIIFLLCHYDYLWQNNSATQLDFRTRHFQRRTCSFLFIPSCESLYEFLFHRSILQSSTRDYWIYCVENCYYILCQTMIMIMMMRMSWESGLCSAVFFVVGFAVWIEDWMG